MPEYIIRWDAGYSHEVELVDAKDEGEALFAAYEHWKEAVESGADYDVVGEATEALKEEHGL